MLGWLEDKYFLNFSAWLREENNTNMASTSHLQKIDFKPPGQSLSHHLFPKLHLKMLARAGPNGDPIFYRRYVDDILVLFSSLDHSEKFKNYLSSQHPNLKFSLEKRTFRKKGQFITNVYRKKTLSGVDTNFNSFIPETYKTSLIKSLLFQYFSLCSDFVKFQYKINILKSILHKNSCPCDFADKYIK